MSTVVIANRGEIALRIIRTAQRLGLRTVAIYTPADEHAPHVRAADDAVEVSSYLNIDEVAEIAYYRGGGDALVHPGYGFLSERAEFARELEGTSGVTLVGPTSAVMDAMGRKDKARDIALAAGVPVVPSYDTDADPEHFDYPVLVKAAAGGGGKGMRVVRTPDDLAAAKAAAAREAASAFGDDTLLIEKFVESGRHVEVQVFGDSHGNVVHLFERDCSTQRRHQKVLEEAPAPTITDQQRGAITGAAVALAKEVGYTNAGTVEFLLDNATGEFYFLEMNTRLQVEHPVTEEVVRIRGERIGLVELQLAIAAGQPLDFTQDDVTLEGHAIEARVYAEDAFGGFLPQAGTATYVGWPKLPGVRVDHALHSGQEVSTSFDPMLGKVIAWGATREDARQLLVRALDQTDIAGLTTNAGFLRALVASDEFGASTIDTAWLDTHELSAPSPDGARALAAYVLAPDSAGDPSPWRADGWRSGGAYAATLVELDQVVAVRRDSIDGVPATLLGMGHDRGGTHLSVVVDGEMQEGRVRDLGAVVEVLHRGQRHLFERPDAFADHAAEAGDGSVLAPMPGTVLAVNAAAGDTVSAGQPLVTMEAMKMELTLKAPYDGTVTTVDAVVGAQVKLGHELVRVEPS